MKDLQKNLAPQIYNLSQFWGHHMPEWPSTPGVNVHVKKFHAKDGIYQTEFEGIMHRGTHMDAPLHVTENTPDIMDYELWRFFGTGVAVSIPKGKWEVITPEDLENARPSRSQSMQIHIASVQDQKHQRQQLWCSPWRHVLQGFGLHSQQRNSSDLSLHRHT